VLCYLPDHEPALGNPAFPSLPRDWTSGASLAVGADLLIHDCQYRAIEYPRHVGWGHSSLIQTIDFARVCGVDHLISFHHDPNHTDSDIDAMMSESIAHTRPQFTVSAGREGALFTL
jgi:ribonuclease BN (tRNA processing enzyme)